MLFGAISDYGAFGRLGPELIKKMTAGEIKSGEEFELELSCDEADLGTMTLSGIVTFTSQEDMNFNTVLAFDNCSIDLRDANPDILICDKIPIVKLNGEFAINGPFDKLTMGSNNMDGIFNNEEFSCSGNFTINMVAEDFPKTGEVCGTNVNTLMEYMEELDKPIEEQEFCAV